MLNVLVSFLENLVYMLLKQSGFDGMLKPFSSFARQTVLVSVFLFVSNPGSPAPPCICSLALVTYSLMTGLVLHEGLYPAFP